MGNTQHIQTNLKIQRNQLALQQAEQAEQSAKKAYMMMDGLMQWGSLQGQDLEPQLQNINSTELVQQTLEQVQPLSTLSGIAILQDIQTQILLTDPRLFAIILRNLLSNALKYSPKDKPILIRGRAENGFWCLSVEDQGAGLPTEQLQSLFKPQQGVQIAQKGSGLGLEIVKQLCDALHIQVSAQNKPDRGAAFELRFAIPNLQASPSIAQDTGLKHYQEETLESLRPLAQQLQILEVYEASAIHRHLNQFGFEQHPKEVQDWLLRLRDSLSLNDEQRYQAILQEVLA
jgi:K+-sensing histidine kinase KdpD